MKENIKDLRIKILEKIKFIKLPYLLIALQEQFENPNSSLDSFEERLNNLLDIEIYGRQTKKINRLLSTSNLKFKNASLEVIQKDNSHGLDQLVYSKLATLKWINEGKNLLITGACGTGKTYDACCLGSLACQNNYRVKYYRTNLLLESLSSAEANDNYLSLLKELANYDLLILDDFGLMNIDLDMCRNLFELIESRNGISSTIIISQYPVINWYDLFKNSTYADAILDRLIYSSYQLKLTGDSFRKTNKLIE